jgi:hypothetical protein
MPRRNSSAGKRHTANGGGKHVFTEDTPVAMLNGNGEIVDTFQVELWLRDNRKLAQQEEQAEKRKRGGR